MSPQRVKQIETTLVCASLRPQGARYRDHSHSFCNRLPAMGVICCQMKTRYLIVGLALIVAGCASPDRNVYDFASREHARWAQQSREKAAADEATAQIAR